MSLGAIRAGKAFVEMSVSGTKKVEASLKRIGARMMAFGKTVAAVGAAAAAATATFAAASVKHFASVGDQVDKMSKRTGASAEALSSIGFAAEQSGASLDAVGAGFKGLAKFTLNAERGLSTATDTLDDLGLSMDDLKGKTPEERFKLFADRIAAIDDPTRKAALAMQVFGRAGSDLLPLLDAGSEGIEAMQRQSDALGRTMSQGQAAAAASLVDAWNEVKSAISGVMVQVGAGLAPALTDIAKLMTELIPTGGSVASSLSGAFDGVVSLVATAADGIQSLKLVLLSAAAAGLTAHAKMQRAIGKDVAAVNTLKTVAGILAEIESTQRAPRASERLEAIREARMRDEEAEAAVQAARDAASTDGFFAIDMEADDRQRQAAAGSPIGDAIRGGISGAAGALKALADQTAGVQAAMSQGLSAVSVEVGDRSARGTFSAAGAGMLGRGGGVAEKQLEEAIKNNRLQEKIFRAIGDLQMRWGA